MVLPDALQCGVCESCSLLVSDYLNQNSFAPSSVEFSVEDLFPRPEIEFALGDRDDNFAAHDLALEMGVCVVFACLIVSIGARRSMWSEFFQPPLIIVMQSRFIVVDEHRCGNVHRVNQTKALGYTASLNQLPDFRCDIDEPASMRHFKPKMFCERFHL